MINNNREQVQKRIEKYNQKKMQSRIKRILSIAVVWTFLSIGQLIGGGISWLIPFIIGLLICAGWLLFAVARCGIAISTTLNQECDFESYLLMQTLEDTPKNQIHNLSAQQSLCFYSGNFSKSAEISCYLLALPDFQKKSKNSPLTTQHQMLLLAYFFDGKLDEAVQFGTQLKEQIMAQKLAESSQKKFASFAIILLWDIEIVEQYALGNYEKVIDTLHEVINQGSAGDSVPASDIRKVRLFYMMAMAYRMLKQENEAKRYCQDIQHLDNKTIFSKMSKIMLEDE